MISAVVEGNSFDGAPMMMHVSCTISTCSFSVMAWNNPLYSFTAPVSNDFSRYANIASSLSNRRTIFPSWRGCTV